MNSIEIGSWVRRTRSIGRSMLMRSWQTKAHLVDSLVAERVVTRCGRQMNFKNANGQLMALHSLDVQEARHRLEVCEDCK